MATIELCDDGSHTVHHTLIDETYHSQNSAIEETLHVYIQAGLVHLIQKKRFEDAPLRVLEVGFGTGLNALMTLHSVTQYPVNVFYHTVECYPLESAIWSQLNYPQLIAHCTDDFARMHQSGSGELIVFNPQFVFKKELIDIRVFQSDLQYDVVYYDAFSPNKQPELWTVELLSKIYDLMKTGGVLVTYTSKGIVKQNLRTAGFVVKRLKGAGGKHHMLRAEKI